MYSLSGGRSSTVVVATNNNNDATNTATGTISTCRSHHEAPRVASPLVGQVSLSSLRAASHSSPTNVTAATTTRPHRADTTPRPPPRIAVGLPLRHNASVSSSSSLLPRRSIINTNKKKNTTMMIAVGLPTIEEDEATKNLISTLVANDMQHRCMKEGSSGRVETSAAVAMMAAGGEPRNRTSRSFTRSRTNGGRAAPVQRHHHRQSTTTSNDARVTNRSGITTTPGIPATSSSCHTLCVDSPHGAMTEASPPTIRPEPSTNEPTYSGGVATTTTTTTSSISLQRASLLGTTPVAATARPRTHSIDPLSLTKRSNSSSKLSHSGSDHGNVMVTADPSVSRRSNESGSNVIAPANQRDQSHGPAGVHRSHSFTSKDSVRSQAVASLTHSNIENQLHNVLEHVGRAAESASTRNVMFRHVTMMDEKREARESALTVSASVVARTPMARTIPPILKMHLAGSVAASESTVVWDKDIQRRATPVNVEQRPVSLHHAGRPSPQPVIAAESINTLDEAKQMIREQRGIANVVARVPVRLKDANSSANDTKKGTSSISDKSIEKNARGLSLKDVSLSDPSAPAVESINTMDEAKRMIREQRGIVNVVARVAARLKDANSSAKDMKKSISSISDNSNEKNARGLSLKDLSSSDHSAGKHRSSDHGLVHAATLRPKNKHEQMIEEKRWERERLVNVTVAAVAQRPILNTANDSMLQAKQLERTRAVERTAITPRLRKPNEGATRLDHNKDDLVDAVRRDHGNTETREDAVQTFVGAKRRDQSHSQLTLCRPSPGSTRMTSPAGEDDLSTSSAYALAMARSGIQDLKEANKLRAYESGPSLAPATNGEIHPGAFALIGRELSSKEQDYGPTLAPARCGDGDSNRSSVPSRHDGNEEERNNITASHDEEPVIFPGAFAVQGLTNQDSESDFSSSSESVGVFDVEPGDHVNGFANQNESQALQAEIYEEVVLIEGSGVAPIDGENTLDSKALKRLRMIQVIILCFSLGAIGLIVGGVFRFSDKQIEGIPVVIGWSQVGTNLVGPTEEPLTLFGSSLALSGDGNRMAIAAPGVDVDNALNAGAVYVMEEKIGENGTEWKVVQIINGPGASTEAHVSLSMSQNCTWLAVGTPHLAEGSQVQVYREQDGEWIPTTQALTGPEDESTWFGYSVDLSYDGTILAIGAPTMDGPLGSESGVVQVYKSSDDSWVQMGSDIGGATFSEMSGWSLSICGQDGFRVAIGAPVALDTTGLVRVFDWNGVDWTQSGTDLLGEIPLNRFGESVSLSHDGKVLAIGARGSSFEPGQAYVYREVNGEWLADPGKIWGNQPGEGFGSSVSLSSDGNTLGVGSPQSNIFGDGAGVMTVFQYDSNEGEWNQEGSAIGSGTVSHLGGTIALSQDGTRIVGGAPTTAFVGSVARAGAALVYKRDTSLTGA